jgi:hypothetical protein
VVSQGVCAFAWAARHKAKALADVNIHNRFMGFLSIMLFISALEAGLPAL